MGTNGRHEGQQAHSEGQRAKSHTQHKMLLSSSAVIQQKFGNTMCLQDEGMPQA